MRFFALLFGIMLFLGQLTAQQGDGGVPVGLDYLLKTGKTIPSLKFNQPDLEALRAEDRINDSLKEGPWRFGYNYDIIAKFNHSGVWIELPNGDQYWFLKISAIEAKTINLTFSNTVIPEGNELYIYNPNRSFILGKFTQNHIYKGELGAEIIPGEESIVEYYVPSRNVNNIGNVEISRVTYGYRTANEYYEKAFGGSGSCNMNVNCPDGAPYKDQRNGVLLIVVNGNGYCSGSLINNTNFDGKPYYLTANHCYSNGLASWIFRFNWQAENCNNPSSSPTFQSVSGAEFRARRTPSDFLLVEIMGGLENGSIPTDYEPFFSGWDRSNNIPTSTICIHHPSGDIKKISFDDNAPEITQGMSSSEANSTWKVVWDRNTTTEGGSSGSPLFNPSGQIIGQLWGGNASCSNAGSGSDYYGRIFNSWEPNGSNQSNQLKYWLDPTDSGVESVIGYDPNANIYENNVAVYSVSNVSDERCSKTIQPAITIFNRGTETLTSLTIKYTYNNNAEQSFQWTGNIEPNLSEVVSLPTMTQIMGENSIYVQLENPNGHTDENVEDNTVSIAFDAAPEGVQMEFKFYMGCWSNENSWELADDNGEILYSGSGGTGFANANYLDSAEFCFGNGCYKLILRDTYGDGVKGSSYTSCDYDGSMTLIRLDNEEIIAELLEEDADFGASITFNFCVGDLGVENEFEEQKIMIYPNPTSSDFTVYMPFEGEKNVIVLNSIGKEIASFITLENELKVDNQKLASGIYLVRINGETIRKIVIQ